MTPDDKPGDIIPFEEAFLNTAPEPPYTSLMNLKDVILPHGFSIADASIVAMPNDADLPPESVARAFFLAFNGHPWSEMTEKCGRDLDENEARRHAYQQFVFVVERYQLQELMETVQRALDEGSEL